MLTQYSDIQSQTNQQDYHQFWKSITIIFIGENGIQPRNWRDLAKIAPRSKLANTKNKREYLSYLKENFKHIIEDLEPKDALQHTFECARTNQYKAIVIGIGTYGSDLQICPEYVRTLAGSEPDKCVAMVNIDPVRFYTDELQRSYPSVHFVNLCESLKSGSLYFNSLLHEIAEHIGQSDIPIVISDHRSAYVHDIFKAISQRFEQAMNAHKIKLINAYFDELPVYMVDADFIQNEENSLNISDILFNKYGKLIDKGLTKDFDSDLVHLLVAKQDECQREVVLPNLCKRAYRELTPEDLHIEAPKPKPKMS